MDIPENESEMMNQIRFSLPIFIGQRYGEAPAELSQRRSDDRSATFSFSAIVRLTSKVVEITSPSHRSDVVVQPAQRIQGGSAPLYSAEVGLRTPVQLDKEFVLSIQAEKLDMPRCVAEIDNTRNTVALMLTLVPRLGAPDVTSQEYIFLVDRSGSMKSESRMDYARDALKHLMKGLPSNNTSFNIVSFGTKYTSLWKKSAVYDRSNLASAVGTTYTLRATPTMNNLLLQIKHIDEMSANMGGTRIGEALDWVFLNRVPNKPTAVFVLTDGEVCSAITFDLDTC